MNKKILFFSFILCSVLVSSAMISAADAHVFTDVSDARLLAIDNAGNTNATGWLAENGVLLSSTYCALAGCTYSGNVTGSTDVSIILGAGGYFVGDGSKLTNIAGANETWTQEWAETLFTNKTYVDFQDNLYNVSIAEYVNAQDGLYNTSITEYANFQDNLYNVSITEYVDAQVAGVGGMDYTNLALTNITNTFTPFQVFSNGLNSSGNINLASTKLVSWVDGGSVSATAGVITYKAGV